MTTKAATKPPAAVRPEPLLSLQREVGRLVDEFRSFSAPRWWRPEPGRGGEAHFAPPAVDVLDEQDHVLVKADLPGMSKDDIEVTLSDRTLTLRGERKREHEVREGDYVRSEREFGSVARSIVLPAEVASEGAKASFKDGVLEIRIPKTEAARRAPVKVAVR